MRKTYILIPVAVALLLIGLKTLNILQGIWADPFVIISTAIVFSIIIYRMEHHIAQRSEQNVINYDNLDVLRYLFSIIIILMHMRPFLGTYDQLDLAFNNIISRICVPFFFVMTGYFVSQKQIQDPSYIRHYIKRMLPTYLFWSILYIPMGIQLIKDMNIPASMLPLALIIALVYVGTCYHLWYFPALFFGLWILALWLKKYSIRSLLILSFVLLCFGATETYFGLLPETIQQILKTYYFQIFYTTRNFLFFGLFYIAMGYAIGEKKQHCIPYRFLKLILCCFLLTAEGILLQLTDRLDSNILISCIPLTYYLFVSTLYTKTLFPMPKHVSLRNLSKYYYLLHPMIIWIVTDYFTRFEKTETIWLTIFCVIGVTHILSVVILWIQQKKKQLIL